MQAIVILFHKQFQLLLGQFTAQMFLACLTVNAFDIYSYLIQD